MGSNMKNKKDTKSKKDTEELIEATNLMSCLSGLKIGNKPIIYFIPNILTLIGLCFGLTTIHIALKEQWAFCIFTVLLAALFDFFDGKVARKLGATSLFGAEFDSISDFATFGIAPAVTIYLVSLQNYGKIGWVISLFFAVCMGMRLARFNTYSIEGTTPEWFQGFSIGVPAPAGAYLLLIPIMFESWLNIKICTFVYAIWTIVTAILLVSKLPTFVLKSKKRIIQPKHIKTVIFVLLILIGSLYSFTWPTMILIGIVYIALIPLSIKLCNKQKEQILSEKDTVK